MNEEKKLSLKDLIMKSYASVAGGESCCAPQGSCSSVQTQESLLEVGRRLGYSEEDLALGLGSANLGLGCGNPRAIAELKKGETVVDLGCGAGFDAFLAGMTVGPEGRVIGVDMTPEMLKKARENAIRLDARNVEFRLGEIEHLPVADASADAIISNCVINLSLDKQKVFEDAFRALKPGGRLAVTDILKKGEIPARVIENPAALSG